uniref:Flavonol synthase n=1 Tax=Saraca asoca TaxID=1073321 RepID=A0AAU7NIR9_9FABA
MAQAGEKASSFTSAMALDQMEVSSIPQRYVLPPLKRPNPNAEIFNTLPIIDFSSLHDESLRFQTINDIRIACKEIGLFQIINHGIPQSIMNGALEVAAEFFNLPKEEKMRLFSDDVHKPVRYGTSVNHVRDEVYCWRDFIKHYSHPLSDWIHMWPSNPSRYKEKMGNYSMAVEELQRKLMEVIFNSLGINPNYLQKQIKKSLQTLAVNCYPACPEPELTFGIPPHSDFGSLTILLQNRPGLRIKDQNNNWVQIPCVEGALIVQVGDQMEVLSNGHYKGVLHMATVNAEMKRISIASLHSFPIENRIGPAEELVDEEHPKAYKEFSFKEFLDFVSNNDVSKGRFIDTLKIEP